MSSDYGFIILRHVNSEKTNKYWNQNVKLLRTFYPDKKIVIIDDNSDNNFLNPFHDYKNVTIINSIHKKRGELLPYFYYLNNKFFDNAIIIHDSVFIHRRINFKKLIGYNVIPLWHFNPDQENISNTLRISNNLKNSFPINQKLINKNELLQLKHNKWYGCFGVQSFINHNFLKYLEMKYGISQMINSVSCRADRCCLERIFGCLFFTEFNKIHNFKSIFGDIMKYQKWGYTYEQYENDFKNKKIPKYVVKVWTGR